MMHASWMHRASCVVRTRDLSLTKGTLLPTELRRPSEWWWCRKRKECLPSCDARSVSVATRIRTGVATATTWSTNHYTMATCLKIVIAVASGKKQRVMRGRNFTFFFLNFCAPFFCRGGKKQRKHKNIRL